MGKPLLSVVVPTKDRYKYLKHLIKLIQSYNSDEWEIVVQDNTDDNTEIVDFLKELNYPGCKYFHEKGQLPMTTNADKAILHSEGEYVCFLGDDDGICPNAIRYCYQMKQEGVEAMRTTLANYNWPDALSKYEALGGNLEYKKVSKETKCLLSDEVLMDVVNRGFVDRGQLPSVYHGIVSRKLLDKVYQRCNTFFPGQSPDISSGIANCLSVDRFLFVDDIVTISGASKYHGGATKGMHKRYPLISDMVWFRPNAENIWNERLPKLAVGNVIWAESSIETLNNMGRKDIVDKVNFETIYKFFVVYHYPVRHLVYPLTSHSLRLKIYSHFGRIKLACKVFMRIVKAKMNISPNGYIREGGINDIMACVNILNHEN